MKIRIEITDNFKKEAKPLLKKYASLKSDLTLLEKELYQKPDTGIPLGSNIYKIRLKISSKNKGKSGGARVITHVETEIVGTIDQLNDETVISLVTIYDKSETANISDKELSRLINQIKK